MNRIDRLMGILTALQAKKHVSAEQLCRQFDISIRTVYRDIKALDEIGVPIGFEATKGYFVADGYFLPPVSFTSDEANALTLMETLVNTYGDAGVKQHCRTALEKIKAAMKGTQKERVEYLRSQIKIFNYPRKPDNYLAQIQNAIVNKTILRIDYENNEGIKSNREVEPIGITFYSNYWHLIAWCWNRNAYRDFNTTRIKKLTETGDTFRIRKHMDINEYLVSLGE